MKALVDTSVWSAALRRDRPAGSSVVHELRRLIGGHLVAIIGPIRQELLSGIRDESQFRKLENHLTAFPDIDLTSEDYVMAAKFFNLCRARGVQGSNTDFLVCAVAVRNELAVFTTDKDFLLFARYLPIILHKPAD